MSRLALPLVLLAAACGGGSDLSVGGHSLAIVDTGYFSNAGSAYCEAMAGKQVELQLVDYTPVCSGASDTAEHSVLRIVFSLLAQSNTANPYEVAPVDCVVGPPTKPALAEFIHYPAGSNSPDFTEQATSGSLKLTNFDLTGATPAKGSFNLTFPSGKASGSFESVACN